MKGSATTRPPKRAIWKEAIRGSVTVVVTKRTRPVPTRPPRGRCRAAVIASRKK
jgi:hypothetical protein